MNISLPIKCPTFSSYINVCIFIRAHVFVFSLTYEFKKKSVTIHYQASSLIKTVSTFVEPPISSHPGPVGEYGDEVLRTKMSDYKEKGYI